jgi:hypothetical protein
MTKVLRLAPMLVFLLKKYLAIGTYVLGNFEKILDRHLDKRLKISYICIQNYEHTSFLCDIYHKRSLPDVLT